MTIIGRYLFFLFCACASIIPILNVRGIRTGRDAPARFGVRIRTRPQQESPPTPFNNTTEPTNRIQREIPLFQEVGIHGVIETAVPVPVVPVVEQHVHFHHIDHVVSHEEHHEEHHEEAMKTPPVDVWDIRDSVPGTPNDDYPVLKSIPRTQFSCQGKISGYYADVDTKCQAFHRCTDESPTMKMDSFLCLNGTTFNQEILSCDWWQNNVRCENSSKFYTLNQELNMRGEDGKYIQLSAKRQVSEDKKVVPGIIPKHERVPLPKQYQSPLNRIQFLSENPPSQFQEHHYSEPDNLIEHALDQEDPASITDVIPKETSEKLEPMINKNDEVDEEDVAYFFTPEQLKTIRSSRGFGEKLKRRSIGQENMNQTIASTDPVLKESNTPRINNISTYGSNTIINRRKSNSTPTHAQETYDSSTSRPPRYRTSGNSFQSSKLFSQGGDSRERHRENYVAENLFDDKLEVSLPLRKIEIGIKKKGIKTIRRLRRLKPKKAFSDVPVTSNQQQNIKQKTQRQYPVAPVGISYAQEEVLQYRDERQRKLRQKHLFHTDITEIYPPYLSNHRLPLYPIGQTHPHYLHGNNNGFVRLSYKSPPVATFPYHHHHSIGTYHRALEPHHVLPPFNHLASNSEDSNARGNGLVKPHHTVTHVVDALNRHHHALVPENPLAAHHFTAESHLAVAAFHQATEPQPHFLNPIQALVPQNLGTFQTPLNQRFPTIYSPTAHSNFYPIDQSPTESAVPQSAQQPQIFRLENTQHSLSNYMHILGSF